MVVYAAAMVVARIVHERLPVSCSIFNRYSADRDIGGGANLKHPIALVGSIDTGLICTSAGNCDVLGNIEIAIEKHDKPGRDTDATTLHIGLLDCRTQCTGAHQGGT